MNEYELQTVFNVFYHYLMVKLPKALFILMLLKGEFFIQLIKNFMKRPKILFVTKFTFLVYCRLPVNGGNGSVKFEIMVRF